MLAVPVHAAKAQLSRLIEWVLGGEEVVITRSDIPVLRLVPAQPPARTSPFGALAGQIDVPDAFFEPLSDDELDLALVSVDAVFDDIAPPRLG